MLIYSVESIVWNIIVPLYFMYFVTIFQDDRKDHYIILYICFILAKLSTRKQIETFKT